MQMNELQAKIGKWADETFGHSPGKIEDIPALIAHMREILGEVPHD